MKEHEFKLSDNDFKFIASKVKDITGIILSDHKKEMVYSRLARRLRALNMTDFKDYCNLITNDNSNEEITNFVNAITTNVTNFFRENHHFEHLTAYINHLKQHKKDKKIRIWSAGCSTGQEPYSIAITLCEVFNKNFKGWDVKILATDIDTNVLNTGKAGIYDTDSINALDSQYQNYFRKKDASKMEASEMIKQLITFNQLNLQSPSWPMSGPFDAIFCRNVMIYFDKETQTKLATRYHKLISDVGYLYIGHSESITNLSDIFKLDAKTVYKKL
jgi:chemotaxis protein methyltransferase CheR